MGRDRSGRAGAGPWRGFIRSRDPGVSRRQAGAIQAAVADCILARAAEVGLRQGDQARRKAPAGGDRLMSQAPIDTARISDYHAHIYYDAVSRPRAALLRQWVQERYNV